MACARIKLPNGGSAIICGLPRSTKRCACGALSTLLCDFPVRRDGKTRTCDQPICEAHATTVGNNVHYCQKHAKEKLKL